MEKYFVNSKSLISFASQKCYKSLRDQTTHIKNYRHEKYYKNFITNPYGKPPSFLCFCSPAKSSIFHNHRLNPEGFLYV